MDSAITNDAKYGHKHLFQAWFDFWKVFDLVSHKLLPGIMTHVGAPPWLTQLVMGVATKWATRNEIQAGKKVSQSTPVSYQRGLFQGDSLAPVLFVLATAPMGYALELESKGYKLHSGETAKYLLYVDDLKVHAASEADIKHTIDVVDRLTNSLGMELGYTKCVISKIVGPKAIAVSKETYRNIPWLKPDSHYD